jgi:hypothetical protein
VGAFNRGADELIRLLKTHLNFTFYFNQTTKVIFPLPPKILLKIIINDESNEAKNEQSGCHSSLKMLNSHSSWQSQQKIPS